MHFELKTISGKRYWYARTYSNGKQRSTYIGPERAGHPLNQQNFDSKQQRLEALIEFLKKESN